MHDFTQALISAPTREEANRFSDLLVKTRLAAGCRITEGASRYWWEGQIVEKIYWNVEAFTLTANKAAIVREIEAIASDDCPIIAFFQYDGNKKFLDWVREFVVVSEKGLSLAAKPKTRRDVSNASRPDR